MNKRTVSINLTPLVLLLVILKLTVWTSLSWWIVFFPFTFLLGIMLYTFTLFTLAVFVRLIK